MLQNLLEESGGGILVITEGVFGMAGDLGKLDKIAALKKKYNFRFLVDDAHGFGTMGATGAGTGEHFGVQDQIDIYFATFAKSMAGIRRICCKQKRSCYLPAFQPAVTDLCKILTYGNDSWCNKET